MLSDFVAIDHLVAWLSHVLKIDLPFLAETMKGLKRMYTNALLLKLRTTTSTKDALLQIPSTLICLS